MRKSEFFNTIDVLRAQQTATVDASIGRKPGPAPAASEWAEFAHSDLPLIIGQDLSRRERGENPVLQHHQHLSGDCEGVRAVRTGNNAAKLARQKCRFDLLT
jgi:hypothetical protein